MRPAVVLPRALRLRTVVTGAVLAVLVGSLGQPVARAAAPTPTQIQTLVNDAITASRAKAEDGLSSTNTFGSTGTTPPHVERYDATSQRYEFRAANGVTSIETPDALYYSRFFSVATDRAIKKLAGRPADSWIRTSASDPRYGEDFNGVQHLLDILLISSRPESSVPQTGSVTPGPDGSTVYAMTWFSGRISGTWTISADGLMTSMQTRDTGFVLDASFTYAPQTVTLPTKTMGRRLYDRATEAHRIPSTVKSLAKQVRLFTNEQPPYTVKEIRKWARKWRDQYNRYGVLDVHVTNVRGGARIWMKNPFTGKVFSRRIVKVGGKAVVRR